MRWVGTLNCGPPIPKNGRGRGEGPAGTQVSAGSGGGWFELEEVVVCVFGMDGWMGGFFFPNPNTIKCYLWSLSRPRTSPRVTCLPTAPRTDLTTLCNYRAIQCRFNPSTKPPAILRSQCSDQHFLSLQDRSSTRQNPSNKLITRYPPPSMVVAKTPVLCVPSPGTSSLSGQLP